MTNDFLEHHGVKGMKWGVRRADKKWQKNIYSTKGAIAVHNNVADRMNNGGLDKLNSNPRYKNVNMFDPKNSKISREYYSAYEKMAEQFTREAVAQVHGTSPSGIMKAVLDTSGDQWRVSVVQTDIEHADEKTKKVIFEVDHDDAGHIIKMANVNEEMAMSDDVEDFLAHYGVQGMKWGVRRATNKANVQRLRDSGLSKRQAKNTNRAQNAIDKQRMTATGRQGKVGLAKQARNRIASNQMLSLGTIVRHPLSSKKAAIRQLQKNKEKQQKILNGEARVTAALAKFNGISVKDLNFETD